MTDTRTHVIGRAELNKYRKGKRLTSRQSIVARCCHCMSGYREGTWDCLNMDCPLHPFMPYRNESSEETHVESWNMNADDSHRKESAC